MFYSSLHVLNFLGYKVFTYQNNCSQRCLSLDIYSIAHTVYSFASNQPKISFPLYCLLAALHHLFSTHAHVPCMINIDFRLELPSFDFILICQIRCLKWPNHIGIRLLMLLKPDWMQHAYIRFVENLNDFSLWKDWVASIKGSKITLFWGLYDLRSVYWQFKQWSNTTKIYAPFFSSVILWSRRLAKVAFCALH